jgi:hypothetical protein
MDAHNLENLEEIAEQTRVRSRGRGGGLFGWHASPNIESAASHCEKKKTPLKKTPRKRKAKKAPKPVAARSPPSAARPAAVAQVFTSYSTLIETCRIRCNQLELSRAELDRLSGLPDGYSAKLLGRDGCGQRQKRAWPISLEALLGALGLKVILIIDEQATARTLALRTPVDRANQRFGNVSRLTPKLLASSAPQPTLPPAIVSPRRRGSKHG